MVIRIKADMVLCAHNTVRFISECVRGVRKDALYKLTLPLALYGQQFWLVLLEGWPG